MRLQEAPKSSTNQVIFACIYLEYLILIEILFEKSDKAKAEELKGQGNKAMAAKNYAEAISLYTQAIGADGTNAIYYGNR
jgi:hypothetical protein